MKSKYNQHQKDNTMTMSY